MRRHNQRISHEEIRTYPTCVRFCGNSACSRVSAAPNTKTNTYPSTAGCPHCMIPVTCAIIFVSYFGSAFVAVPQNVGFILSVRTEISVSPHFFFFRFSLAVIIVIAVVVVYFDLLYQTIKLIFIVMPLCR